MSKLINLQFKMATAFEVDKEERETNIRLIRLVTNQPALWDSSCPQYRDKGYKRAVITELAKHMNWTEDAVIKKFANLRTYYTKELNKELLSQVRCKATGDSSDIYRSKWPYYELLNKFLRKQVRTVKKVHSRLESINSPSVMRVNCDTDSIEHIPEVNNDDQPADQLDSPVEVNDNYYDDWDDDPIPRKVIKQEPVSLCESELSVRDVIHQTPSILHETTPTHITTPTQPQSQHLESSDEIFAKLVSHQLKRVGEGKKKEMLKIKIQQLIVEALFDE